MPKQATGSIRHRLRPEPSFDSSTPATAPPAIPAGAHAARFGFVIAGAGTAGSVLAARLTEQPDVRVLLLEAGPAVPEIGENLYADECVVGDEPVRETISATVLPCLALDVTRHGQRTARTP